MSTPLLQLHPALTEEPSLSGHRGVLESLGRKLEEKQRSLASLDVLWSARAAQWEALAELKEEIWANNRSVVVLTEGLTESVLRAALALFEGARLEPPEITVRVISSSLGTEALGRLADEMVGRSMSLYVMFFEQPSPRLLWTYRLLYSRLAQGRPTEELKRRVVLAAGTESSDWGEWARRSGFRALHFPARCAGRFLFFSEPIALALGLCGVPAWQCVEGGRSLVRAFDKQAGLSDPLMAYAALREVQLGERCREALMVPDETFAEFARWWRLMGEESRWEFSEGLGESLIHFGAVLQQRTPSQRRQWVTEVRVEGDRALQVEALPEMALDPWEGASKRHWAPLEPHYDRAIDFERTQESYASPSVRLRLRRCDALSVGALFAFFEGAMCVSHRLADLDDVWRLLQPRTLREDPEISV